MVGSAGAARKRRPETDGFAPAGGQTGAPAERQTAARAERQTFAAAERKSAPAAQGPSAAPATVPAGPQARPRAKRSDPVDLDRLIHERVRLGIVSALAVTDTLSFNELKHLLGTTDGNLSVHARRLEEAGYVDCSKSFDGRTPRTEYRLTTPGRAALRRYLDHMTALIERVRDGSVSIFAG
jgi:DNA-binding MarR family transcriptional regulator